MVDRSSAPRHGCPRVTALEETSLSSRSTIRDRYSFANLDDDAFGEAVVYNASRGIEVRRHDGS